MQTLRLIPVAAALAALACVPTALHWFASEDTVVAVPLLEGVWKGGVFESKTTWTFHPGDDESTWRLIGRNPAEDESTTFTAVAFRLGDELFLDLSPVSENLPEDDYSRLFWLGTHTAIRIRLEPDRLRWEPIPYDTLDEQLKEQPDLLPHERVELLNGESRLVLTGSTEQLQAFLRERTSEIFPDDWEDLRLAATPRNPADNPGRAARVACGLANNACQKKFDSRPFKPESWTAQLIDGRWRWGRNDSEGPNGFSAVVSFRPDGADPRVEVFANESPDPTSEPETSPEAGDHGDGQGEDDTPLIKVDPAEGKP